MAHFDDATRAGSTGRSLRCQSCGAAFALLQLTPFVQCPHCHQHQQLPPALLAELQRYQQHVAQHQAVAQQHYQHAEAWQRWTTGKASNPKKNFFMAYGLLLGPAIVLSALAAIVNSMGLLPEFFRGPGLSFTLMGLTYGGVGVYLVWYFSGGRAKRRESTTRTENVAVACPNCGALGMLTPGEAVDTCNFCRAALVPSQTTMLRAVDAAELHARKAQMERYRLERKGMANVQGYNVSNLLPFILAGSFLLPLGGSAVMISIQMLRGAEPYNPAIFLLWVLTFALAGGLFGFHHLRKQKRAAFTEALGHVLHQFPGCLHDRVDVVVSWLNQFWSARYQTQFLMTGPYAMLAWVNARGFPAFLYVDPVSGGQHHSPKLHLLLAAWPRPSRQVDQASANAHRARLAQIGFEVSETEAGLMAIADRETQKRAARRPATLHELTPAVFTLTLLAEARGLEPAQPIP